MPGFGRDLFAPLPSVPPPMLGAFRPVRFVKKKVKGVAKGVKKGAKGIAKGAKAFGLAAAKLAAKPIASMFRKLAMRRARMMSWKGRKSLQPDAKERREAAAWALVKVGRKGPIGKLAVKILQFTKSATLGEYHVVGMTGVEIAAAAAAIVGAIASIMKSLNKPGEAPEDPRKGTSTSEEEDE